MKITKLIKTEEEYEQALKRIDEIFDAEKGSKEFDELELLIKLTEFYEEENFKILPPDPIEAIKFRMEQENLSNSDMIKYLGSKSKVSEVFSRKRPLSLTMIRKISR